jgi:hypothetical protein
MDVNAFAERLAEVGPETREGEPAAPARLLEAMR